MDYIAKFRLHPFKNKKFFFLGILLLLTFQNKIYAQTYELKVCSGIPFSFIPPSEYENSTFTWETPTILPAGSIQGLPEQSSQTTDISGLIDNPLDVEIAITYEILTSEGKYFTLIVKILPSPTLSNKIDNLTVCNGGLFDFQPESNVNETTFEWTRNQVTGISNLPAFGYGNPMELLNNETNKSIIFNYAYKLNSNGCINTQNVFVELKPNLNFTSPETIDPICSGNKISYIPTSNQVQTTFNWSRTVINGISNPASTGLGSIEETLINKTTKPISVTYNFTLSDGNCFTNKNVSVIVQPEPTFLNTGTLTPICSGSNFEYEAVFNNTTVSYKWTRNTNEYINNGTIDSGRGNIKEPLRSNFVNPVEVSYQFISIDTISGCSSKQSIRVYVNPQPIIADTVITTCSGNTFLLSPKNVPYTTVFTWIPTQVTENRDLGAVTVNQPQRYVSQKLINNSSKTLTQSYIVSTSAAGCKGDNFNLDVKVNPINRDLQLTNKIDNEICSGKTFNYTPLSTLTATRFNWKRLFNPSLPFNGVGINVGQINETLINATTVPTNVEYLYLLSDAAGCSNLQIINLTINPTSSVANSFSNLEICSNDTIKFSPIPTIPGSTIKWNRTQLPSIIYDTLGNDNLIYDKISNTGNVPINLKYNFISTTNKGCTNENINFTIRVNPIPDLINADTIQSVCSGIPVNFTPLSNVSNTVFNWRRAADAGIENLPDNGNGMILESLINKTENPINVHYQFQFAANGCIANKDISIKVNPVASLKYLSNQLMSVCNQNDFVLNPQSTPANTKFIWDNPVIFPDNSISNFTIQTKPVDSFSQRLINNTKKSAIATYLIKPLSGSCMGDSFKISVLVKPSFTTSPIVDSVCSGAPYENLFNEAPLNTSYIWNNPVINTNSNITGSIENLLPTNKFNQTLVNSGTSTESLQYSVIPKTGECHGDTIKISLNVKPSLIFSKQVIPEICSGQNFLGSPLNKPIDSYFNWNWSTKNNSTILSYEKNGNPNDSVITGKLFSKNLLQDTAILDIVPNVYGCTGPTFEVYVPINPTPSIENISDSTCSNIRFFNKGSNTPSNTLYTWDKPILTNASFVEGMENSTSPQLSFSQQLINNSNTPISLSYLISPKSGECVGNPFTITKTVIPLLNKIANIQSTNCSNTNFQLPDVNLPIGTEYTWTVTKSNSFEPIFGAESSVELSRTINQVLINKRDKLDSAIYLVTPNLFGCSGEPFNWSALVIPPPFASISGKQIACNNPIDTLQIQFKGTGPWQFDFLDNGREISKSNSSDNSMSYIINRNGNESLHKYAITSLSNGVCTNTQDTIQFVQQVKPFPKVEINTSNGSFVCDTKNETLSLISKSDDIGTINWKMNNQFIPNSNTRDLIVSQPGKYQILVTSIYGCTDSNATAIAVKNISKPILNFALSSTCINTLIQLKNTSDTINTGQIIWDWKLENTSFSNNVESTLRFEEAGYKQIKLIAKQRYCPSNVNIKDSIIHIVSPIKPIRLNSISTYKNTATPISARELPNYSYQWFPSIGLQRTNSFNTVFNNGNSQEYTISMKSPEGCITVDSITVRAFEKDLVNIFVPKSFTPNNDGTNDILYPYLSGIKTFSYFKIFNRYGQLIFETKNPDQGWNGKFQGIDQPISIYIWTAEGITENGKLINKKGEILLLR